MTAEPIQLSEAAQRRKVGKDGMGYVWDVAEHNVRLRADYLSVRSDEMHAELTVTRNEGHLYLARFNLTSSTSRTSLVKALDGVTEGLDIPWKRLVEQFSVAILRKEREGEPTRYTGPAKHQPIQYLVDRLVIRGKTNMLFAPGGAGKGYLCVALCAAVVAKQGLGDLGVGPAVPFYFDWEDDFDTFNGRLNAVARGMGIETPRLAYRRMRGLVPDRINEMAKAMSDAGANFGLIDSFSAAGGTTSERTSWDTVAHRLFDALDLIPDVTWEIIDHVAGDKVADPVGKAYGSIQKMNRVRNAWEMRSEQEAGSPMVHMKLFDAKWNHTGKRKPMGLRMEFDGESVSFTSEEPGSSSDGPLISIATRMGVQLAAGPLSTDDLARVCKTTPGSVRDALSKNKHRFRRDDDGILIRLVRQDAPAETDEPKEPLPW